MFSYNFCSIQYIKLEDSHSTALMKMKKQNIKNMHRDHLINEKYLMLFLDFKEIISNKPVSQPVLNAKMKLDNRNNITSSVPFENTEKP